MSLHKNTWTLRSPRAIFILVFLCVLALVFIYPDLWYFFIGVAHLREDGELLYPFLDMMSRLAVFEGHRAGLDMLYELNPFDPMQRFNSKPSWPLHLSFLGLGTKHVLFMGTLTSLGMALLVISLVRPRRWLEVPLMLALCLSPAVMLGIERANDDLVYLLLLAIIPLALKWRSTMRVWLVWLIIFLLAPAKFYPGAAFAVLLLEVKSWRLLFGMIALGAVFLSGYLYVYWEELTRLMEIMPRPAICLVHGVSILPLAAGLPGWVVPVLIVLLVVAGLWAILAPKWPELSAPIEQERWFILGASVWFFCYIANSNFDYRFIFFIPMFPLLLHLSRAAAEKKTIWHRLGTYWLILLVPAFWLEIGFLHYFRAPSGVWASEYYLPVSALKNLILLPVAFLVVIFSGTILRPRIRELWASWRIDYLRKIPSTPIRPSGKAIVSDKFLTWVLALSILLPCLVFVFGAWSYPLSEQHDSGFHFSAILNLFEEGSYASYVGIYYYGLIVLTLKAIVLAGFAPDGYALQAGVVFVNLICFLGFLSGCYRLFREFSIGRKHAFWLVACCASFPVLQGQFRMVRPENFLLLVSIWSFVWFLIYLRKPKSISALLTCSLLLMLAITQKISGLVVAATLPLFYLCFLGLSVGLKEHLRTMLKLVLVTGLATGLSWIWHYNYTGTWFFQSNAQYARAIYDHTPTPDVFVRVNPVEAWRHPLRDAQRDSLINILLLDLYGDYWGYRYGLENTGNTEIGLAEDAEPAHLKARARFGLLLSFILFSASIGSVHYLLRWRCFRPGGASRMSLACMGGVFLGFAYLVAAAYTGNYSPEDFDLAKWEYICWVLPFFLIPVGYSAELHHLRAVRVLAGLAIGILIAGGVAQSIY